MQIQLREGCDHREEIRLLFTEYTDALVLGDPAFRDYLSLQNFEEEMAHLEHKYGRPQGRLFIAYHGDTPVGCVGLRRLEEGVCEMKRMYVRPSFRGKGLGGQLARLIIAEARDIGYSRMLLDTLPFLTTAIDMYRRLGFYDIPSYNNSPMEGLVYLRLDL